MQRYVTICETGRDDMFKVAGTERHVRALFQAGAVWFTHGQAIRYKSGILAPGAYNDNRKLPSYPTPWEHIVAALEEVADDLRDEFDIIASVANGAVPHGSALAFTMALPHVIVKKEEKVGHGLKGFIDGDTSLLRGAKVLLFEDMSSTFESAQRAMKPLEAHDATVVHTLAISTWGFPKFYRNTEGHEVTVLCTGEMFINFAAKNGLLDRDYELLLRQWHKNPEDESWVDDTWPMPAG